MLYKRAFRTALIVFLAIRILSIVFVLVASQMIPPNPPPAPSEPAVVSQLQNGGSFSRLFLLPWYRWDTVHYLQIADWGYSYNLQNTVWPPLYPALIRVFGLIIKPSLLASLVVANLAAIAALFLLYLVVTDCWGEERARNVVLWTAIFPSGFFLLAGYTESLFLALALGAMLAARRNEWWLAGFAGALAAMTRLTGLFLALPILWMAWKQFRRWRRRERWLKTANILAATSLLPLSVLAFSLYVRYGLKAEWPWQTLSADWHLVWAAPWAGIAGTLQRMAHETVDYNAASQFMDVVLSLWAVFVLGYGLKQRRIPMEYMLYTLLLLLPSLTKILDNQTLMSVSRYLLPIFPLFVIWDQMAHPRRARVVLAVASLAGQFLLIYMFYRWIWVA